MEHLEDSLALIRSQMSAFKKTPILKQHSHVPFEILQYGNVELATTIHND